MGLYGGILWLHEKAKGDKNNGWNRFYCWSRCCNDYANEFKIISTYYELKI